LREQLGFETSGTNDFVDSISSVPGIHLRRVGFSVRVVLSSKQ
jgi:hypothetical protein